MGRRFGVIALGFAWGVAALILATIGGVVIGFVCSAVGVVHGEAAAWFPLISGYFGFLAGLVIGPVACWITIARGFALPRKTGWIIAIGLLTVIPTVEYAILRSPAMTGPTPSTTRLNIEAVSNNGDMVLLTASKNNSSLIYKVDTRTGNATRLTEKSAFEEAPHLSPDDKQVVFIAGEQHDGPSEIMLCNIDGSNRHTLLSQSHQEFAPQFAKSGRSLFFARPTSLEGRSQSFEIRAVGVDGRDLTQQAHITFAPDENTHSLYPASISDDETQVLLKASTKTGDKLLIYSLIDQSRAPVVIVPKIPNGPAHPQIAGAYFSDDKTVMLMAASEGAKGYAYDLYRLDVAFQTVQKLTNTNAYASDFTLSSRGESAAFFVWSLSRLNSVPINPKLQLLNTRTGNVSTVAITGLP